MKITSKLHPQKATTLMVAIGLSIVVLGAVGAYVVLRPNAKPSTVAPASIPKEQAIPKAEEYLLRNLDNMDPTLRLMLDFLYRKFSINSNFSGQINRINTSAEDSPTQFELKAVARIAYKESLVNELGPSPSLVAIGANCDHISLPTNISALLQQEIDRGGYELTHAFLSLQMIKELDCKLDNADSLREQAIAGMLTIAEDDKTDRDLRYECIAFLLYGGKLDSIDPAWIDQIYAAQRSDGGWGTSKQDPNSNDHPTVLALWALLEYTRLNVPYEPIIHQAD